MGFNLATPGGLPTYLKNAYTERILLIILLMIFLVILLIMITLQVMIVGVMIIMYNKYTMITLKISDIGSNHW